jgi:glycerol-3-phosphate dehydrogenase subunit B
MIAGVLDNNKSSRVHLIVIGFEKYLDFYPELIAENLNAHGISSEGISLDVPSLAKRRITNSNSLTRLFETQEFRQEVVKAIKNRVKNAQKIAFPAVLGTNRAVYIKNELESSLGVQVFEIPTLPPSTPGKRLHNILTTAIEEYGGHVYDGMEVLSADADETTINTVWTEAAARLKPHHSKSYVFAAGGILGGGIFVNRNGYAQEAILNLPVEGPTGRDNWFNRQFLSSDSHPIYLSGINVNDHFRPVNDAGEIIYHNLHVIGSALTGFDAIKERSMEGIALTTGYYVGSQFL